MKPGFKSLVMGTTPLLVGGALQASLAVEQASDGAATKPATQPATQPATGASSQPAPTPPPELIQQRQQVQTRVLIRRQIQPAPVQFPQLRQCTRRLHP